MKKKNSLGYNGQPWLMSWHTFENAKNVKIQKKSLQKMDDENVSRQNENKNVWTTKWKTSVSVKNMNVMIDFWERKAL